MLFRSIAARKAASIVENAQRVAAMELAAACQALDLRAIQLGIPSIEPLLSPRSAPAYRLVRSAIDRLDKDRVMYPDLDSVYGLIGAVSREAAGAIANEGSLD